MTNVSVESVLMKGPDTGEQAFLHGVLEVRMAGTEDTSTGPPNHGGNLLEETPYRCGLSRPRSDDDVSRHGLAWR